MDDAVVESVSHAVVAIALTFGAAPSKIFFTPLHNVVAVLVMVFHAPVAMALTFGETLKIFFTFSQIRVATPLIASHAAVPMALTSILPPKMLATLEKMPDATSSSPFSAPPSTLTMPEPMPPQSAPVNAVKADITS